MINFWADWSATSRMISPMFEEHAGEYTDIRFYAVDVDAYPEIGESIGIRAVRGLAGCCVGGAGS